MNISKLFRRHKKCNFNKSPQSFCWVVTIERFNAVGKLVFTWVRASLVKLLPDASSELNEVYGTPPPNPTSSRAPCFPFRALSLGSEGFQEWSSQPSKSIKRVETCKTVHLAWRLTLTTDAHTQTHAPRPLLPQRKRLHQNSPHLLAQSAPRPGWDWTRFITPLWCISSFNFTALHLFPRQDQLWAQIKTEPSHICRKSSASSQPLCSFEANQEYHVKMRGRHVNVILCNSSRRERNAGLLSMPLWGG